MLSFAVDSNMILHVANKTIDNTLSNLHVSIRDDSATDTPTSQSLSVSPFGVADDTDTPTSQSLCLFLRLE